MIRPFLTRFIRSDEGLALTEYLILLGLLVAGVAATITLVGGDLNTAWSNWTSWFSDTLTSPSTSTDTTTTS